MENNYDSSWDLVSSDKGYLPQNEKLFEKKWDEWNKRDWIKWLKDNLSFPFTVRRMEDDDNALFSEYFRQQPFRLGHTMEVIRLESNNKDNGIIIKVKEGQEIGYIPLCDVEVRPKTDKNFWPVREYVIWFTNWHAANS